MINSKTGYTDKGKRLSGKKMRKRFKAEKTNKKNRTGNKVNVNKYK